MKNSLAKMSFEKIMTNKEKYAKEFSEGDIYLEKLLLKLWNQGIHTVGCCRGHNEKKGYIGFNLNINRDKIEEFIRNIKKENIIIGFTHSNNKYNMNFKADSIEIITKNIDEKRNDFKENIEKTMDYLNKRKRKEYLNIQFHYYSNLACIYVSTCDKEIIDNLKEKYEYIILNQKLGLYQFIIREV